MSLYSYFSDSFNSVDLIKLIEQTPVLWYVHHASHNNKQLRQKAWESIAAKIVKNWSDLTEKDKFGCLTEIKSKWKNIKDTFTKDQKLRNKPKSKKRKYIYSDVLQFLNYGAPENFFDPEDWKKTEQDEDAKSEPKNANPKEEIVDSNDETEPEFIDSTNFSDDAASSDSSVYEPKTPPPSVSKNILFVDDSLTVDHSSKPKEPRNTIFVSSSSGGAKNCTDDTAKSEDDDLSDDADKMFLLSLVPLFKNLNEHDKIVARIQLTQVLQRLLYPKK